MENKDIEYLLFFPTFGGGGAESVFITIANEMHRRGLNVAVVVARGNGELTCQIDPKIPLYNLSAWKTILSAPRVYRVLKTIEPSVVVSFSIITNFILCLLKLLMKAPPRIVISERAVFTETMARSPYFVKKTYPLILRFFYRYSDHLIAVSDDVRSDLYNYTDFKHSKISVINNPILANPEELRTGRVKRFKGRPYILAIGRLHIQKNFEFLIRQFALIIEMHDYNLIICGEGPERKELETLIVALGLVERVFLIGFRRNVKTWLLGSKVVASTSLWEGLPGALINAVSLGKRVVALECKGGVREILRGGEFGRLVPIENANLFHLALSEELDMDSLEHTIFKKERLIEWRRQYAIEDRVNDYVKIFDNNHE